MIWSPVLFAKAHQPRYLQEALLRHSEDLEQISTPTKSQVVTKASLFGGRPRRFPRVLGRPRRALTPLLSVLVARVLRLLLGFAVSVSLGPVSWLREVVAGFGDGCEAARLLEALPEARLDIGDLSQPPPGISVTYRGEDIWIVESLL